MATVEYAKASAKVGSSSILVGRRWRDTATGRRGAPSHARRCEWSTGGGDMPSAIRRRRRAPRSSGMAPNSGALYSRSQMRREPELLTAKSTIGSNSNWRPHTGRRFGELARCRTLRHGGVQGIVGAGPARVHRVVRELAPGRPLSTACGYSVAPSGRPRVMQRPPCT